MTPRTERRTAESSRPARRRALATLREFGPVRDRSGRATSLLAQAMGYESRPVSLNPLLLALEADGLIDREVRGRRCFTIELTDKGQAMVDLDDGLQRRPQPSAAAGEPAAIAERHDSAVEMLRRDLREVLMELGALRRRVAELERGQHQRTTAGASVDAPVSGRADVAG